jgi:hypothetical protein
MPNIPPDGWEGEIEKARAQRDAARRDLDELRARVGPPGGDIPASLDELRAALDALTRRVEELEAKHATPPGTVGL